MPKKKRSLVFILVVGIHTLAIGVLISASRAISGEDTEWTSDRCYVVSDPPLPGEPDFLEHARVTHFGCLPPAGPGPGEMFKDLPAYKKYDPH